MEKTLKIYCDFYGTDNNRICIRIYHSILSGIIFVILQIFNRKKRNMGWF